MSSRLSLFNVSSNVSQEDLREVFGQFKGFKSAALGVDARSGLYLLI
jgi:hypothetical protein